MSKKFTEYSQLNLSEINKEVLKKWDENDVFSKSMTEREGYPSFVILDTEFLKTLDTENICSGYAEMLAEFRTIWLNR